MIVFIYLKTSKILKKCTLGQCEVCIIVRSMPSSRSLLVERLMFVLLHCQQ